MSDNLHFIYPTTFPKEVGIFERDRSIFTLGPMSLSQAVKFYWRLQNAMITASLNISVYDNLRQSQIWDEHESCCSISCAAGYAAAETPSRRCVPKQFYRGAQEPYPTISGPYMDDSTSDFEYRNFYYTLDFYFAAGPVVLQPTPCDENYGADMTTYKQFRFTLFDNIYSVYMNVPSMFVSPTSEYNVQIDGNCEINFNFYMG